jgi:hypothetical protein
LQMVESDEAEAEAPRTRNEGEISTLLGKFHHTRRKEFSLVGLSTTPKKYLVMNINIKVKIHNTTQHNTVHYDPQSNPPLFARAK